MNSFLKALSFVFERIVNFPSKMAFRMNLIRNWSAVGWFIDKSTWEFGMPERALKPEPIQSIFPGIEKVSFQMARPYDRKRGTSLEVDELCALLAMLKHSHCESVLEVGTYDGNTALNFALNTSDEGNVATIDLPAGGSPAFALPVERSNANPSEVIGRQFYQTAAAPKITSVRQDTAVLDWESLPGPFDMIFIDGCHEYSYVKNDTEKALKVLKRGGLVIWHDYNLEGVGKYLDEFGRKDSCRWIQGTRLVICRPEKAGSDAF